MPAPLMATLRLEVTGIPELEMRLRGEMARLLREASLDEAPAISSRLQEVAAVFETGLSDGSI